MEKSKKKKLITKEEIFPLVEEEREADHVVDGFHVWDQNQHEHFNDDLSEDLNDYEGEICRSIRRRTTYCSRQIFRTLWKKP